MDEQTGVKHLELEIADSLLIEESRRGNVAAFNELYTRYAPMLYSVAYKYHGNVMDAEDTIQETFLKVFQKLEGFKGHSQLSTWLYRITVNICISQKRKNRPCLFDVLPDHLQPCDTGEIQASDDTTRLLSEAILELSPRYRCVFLLFASEGKTHAEIAEILEIPENTSKSHYHRAKKRLRKYLLKRGIRKGCIE